MTHVSTRGFSLAAMLALGLSAAGLQAAPLKIGSPYPELLGGVCADLRHIGPAASPSLQGKELLLEEAERLNLPHETRELLTERLRNNAFSIAEAQLWAPFESFDVALQARSEEAGVLKAKFSVQRYGEYAERLGRLPAEQQDAIRRGALTILAESGHLPEVIVSDDGGVRFVYREACLVNDAPGLMTTFIQGRERELDPVTGALGPTVPLRPEMATLSDPAVAFSSSGAGVVQLRAEQVDRVFQTPAARGLLQEVHDEILEIIAQPERMKARLLELVALFEGAYGIEPVTFDFDTRPTSTGGSGYYLHSARTYTFYYQRFIQKLGRFLEREGLDLAREEDRARARKYMFGELVNNAAHELTHAGQYQWLDRWTREPASVPGELQPRVADYQKNHRYKNTAWESHALIGLLGAADYERYRHQPLEEDAWAVGGHAETLALELISTAPAPREGAVIEVKRDDGALHKTLPVVYAPQQ